jgi:Ni,Fe-hydrogenase III small subunit
MSSWFWHGLRKGVRSTRYPGIAEQAPGVSPGRPVTTDFSSPEQALLAAADCPVGAIAARGVLAHVDLRACIHCQRCRSGGAYPLDWAPDYEWTTAAAGREAFTPLPAAYRRSVHVIVVDAGDCGACLHEVKQLNNPFYNVHRLGIFFTASPRAADVLLVVGPVTENMRLPLVKTYEAMPAPKRVVAVGTCAITGGVFGRTFISAGGAASVVPVDLEIPGEPPPPLAILHGLLVVTGRKMPVAREPWFEGGPKAC